MYSTDVGVSLVIAVAAGGRWLPVMLTDGTLLGAVSSVPPKVGVSVAVVTDAVGWPVGTLLDDGPSVPMSNTDVGACDTAPVCGGVVTGKGVGALVALVGGGAATVGGRPFQ
jgi:hypothetical protein